MLELLRHRCHVDANAAALPAGRTNGAGHHLGKLGARSLEARGVGVGDVVTNDVQILAGGVQAREALLKTHGVLLNQ